MDPTDAPPPSTTIAGLRRHAAEYIAHILSTCQLRGAFTLEEVDGLIDVVRGLQALAANEAGDGEESADADDDNHSVSVDPTLHSLLWPHAWKRLVLAQERGKLSLREAWSVYNAMQLCGGGGEDGRKEVDTKGGQTEGSATEHAAEASPPGDGTAAGRGGARACAWDARGGLGTA